MFEIVTFKNDQMTIKNTKTNEKMTFNSWLEMNKFIEILKELQDEMIPF